MKLKKKKRKKEKAICVNAKMKLLGQRARLTAHPLTPHLLTPHPLLMGCFPQFHLPGCGDNRLTAEDYIR